MIYRLLRALMRLALRGFFRHVAVQGRELVPPRDPVLFVANHTNALVDPLLLLTGLNRRVTLTAKSTLAGQALLAPLIRAFDVVLFRRASDRAAGEDGADAAANDTALGECVARLRRGAAVFLFPEGVSHSDVSMRSFKTGAARIVVRYLEDAAAAPLWIVPVGLHFSRKDRWRSEAVALIGQPIAARSCQGMDAVALTRAMRGWVEALTVNFASAEERELVTTAQRLLAYRPEGPPPLDQPAAMNARERVALTHRLQRGVHVFRQQDPAAFGGLAGETRALQAELDRLGVDAAEVGLPMHWGRAALFVLRELEVMVLGAPLALAGAVLHAVPLGVTRRLVRAMSKDEDHPASNAVFLSLPIFLAWWLVLDLAALLLLGPWALGLAAVAVPYAGVVNLQYRDRAGGVVRRLRTFLLWLSRPEIKARVEDRVRDWQARIRAIEPLLAGPSMRFEEAT